ncbi:hypothetical protein LWC34_18065 [Kibdelosporangium philippinense]|uniref:Baseplate protein J-like domain-containing protein n=1 Tax=Kibdelosporangium philippinense TaxID=211113 RepID=A0ABS8ZA80_9PSEU|nr:hypothetical protein [Kibdelosporangium philippinense]MCE7004715.1 hypothetical protein [Kibdelosporangium philippinense]
MGWWTKATREPAESWFFTRIGAATTAAVEPDVAYVSAFLRSMRLADRRVGTTTYRGSVTSSISLPTRTGGNAELIVVAAPKLLAKLDASNQDRVVTVNIRLLGPIPYRGGDIEVELGLFSIPQSDLVEPYLAVLDELSTLAGVSLAAPALPLVKTVKSALNLLVGAQNETELEIGVLTTFEELLPGDYCVVRAPRDFAQASDLTIATDGRLLGPDGKEITKPYLVFTVSTTEQRADWFKIPEIRVAYEEIREAARRGDLQRAQEGERAFRRIATTCDDLLRHDGVRLADLVDKEIDAAFGESVLTSAPVQLYEMPDLKHMPLYSE